MIQITNSQDNSPEFNKKAIRMILILIALGIITGLMLSYVFINEANHRIENIDRFVPKNGDFNPKPLLLSDVILPSIGVIIVCISTFLLLGLIVVYFKIFLTSNSKYVMGLLFFLTPLFIKSIFSVNTLGSLFVSPAIPYKHIRESIGFGFGGLGGVIILVSIFEIIGLSILLYLSSE
jgi:magnesium-transporting ATPase (P-type)